jgi:Zn-dependent metalloprotease
VSRSIPLVLGSLALFSLQFACGLQHGGARAPLFLDGSPEELELAVELSLDALGERAGTLGQLEPVRVEVDELGMAHVRLQQRLDGVPVFGGEAIVHLHSDGAVASISDSFVPDPQVDTRPLVTADEALELALLDSLAATELTSEPEVDLYILRHERADHLVWSVQLERIDFVLPPTQPRLFIDAHSGDLLWSYENLHTATGVTNYYGTVSVGSYFDKTSYYLEDTSRNIGTYTAANGTTALYYIDDSDGVYDQSWQYNGVEGHYAASAVYDYYYDTFGRDGIDDAGGPGYVTSLTGAGTVMTVVVDYDYLYANAFWSGDYMAIGGGDGKNYSSLSTLDIVGHEMTHGVTENTANLTYYGESGAVDESLADIFGAMVERHALGESSDTWLIGEECVAGGTPGMAIRYMSNPSADGYSRDHYDDLYTGPLDNGGVHDNAGIGYLAYYLASEGGSHPTHPEGSMYGMGADDAEAIWYRALTTYMTSSTDFAAARDATLSAATDLYGNTSVQYNLTAQAWTQVGVGCHETAPGTHHYCTPECQCTEGEGLCVNDADCTGGTVCGENRGADYGLDWWKEVCVPASADCHDTLTLGKWNYCSAECPCDEGEGSCDGDDECGSGLTCTENAGADYGLDWWVDVCVPTATDCHGGAALGAWNYCTTECVCDEGEGTCQSDAGCGEDLECTENAGADYGLDWWVDVCTPKPSDCHGTIALGAWNFCATDCTCGYGEGGCAGDETCDEGLVCTENAGADYGLDWWVDVCIPDPHACHDGTLGAWNYCTADCVCGEGMGGCDGDEECEPGLTCQVNRGADYGLNWWVDVCAP